MTGITDISEATGAARTACLFLIIPMDTEAINYQTGIFGAYIAESRDWDNLMYNSPYYLMVVAAG